MITGTGMLVATILFGTGFCIMLTTEKRMVLAITLMSLGLFICGMMFIYHDSNLSY
jgi:hypothetical protein